MTTYKDENGRNWVPLTPANLTVTAVRRYLALQGMDISRVSDQEILDRLRRTFDLRPIR